ncbi:MAG: hypothetical protein M3Z32_09810 [Acidobacteriota bacterium]|nr:hypothetical protein [Acidobacteriota bacterium]
MKNKSAAPSILICLFIALTFAAYSSPAWATTTNWTGASNSDWFNPNNWDNGIPTYLKDAFINNGGKAAINSPGATARTLTLGAGAGDSGTVVVDGTYGGALSVGSNPRPCGGATNQGAPFGVGDAEGQIIVGYGGSGTLSITNGGAVSSESGFVAYLGGGEVLNSNGTVTVDGAGSNWTLGGCTDWRLSISGPPYTFSQGGTALLSVTNGGQVVVNDPLGPGSTPVTFVGISGTLTGDGAITVNGAGLYPSSVNIAGTLAPNGALKVKGTLILSSHDVLQCDTWRRGSGRCCADSNSDGNGAAWRPPVSCNDRHVFAGCNAIHTLACERRHRPNERPFRECFD